MNIKSSIIISIALILAAAIHNSQSIVSLLQRHNIIHTTAGKFVMGEVYSESVVSSVSIKSTDGVNLLEVSGLTSNIYDDSVVEMKNILNATNKDKTEKDKIKFENATLAKDVVLEMKTSVKYRSELQSDAIVQIDSSSVSFKADDKPMSEILKELNGYSTKMIEKYKKENSFIN